MCKRRYKSVQRMIRLLLSGSEGEISMRSRVSHLVRTIRLGVFGVAFACFAIPSHAAKLTTLVSFCELAGCLDGADPNGPLLLRSDGHLLGTTTTGGALDEGTFFEIRKTFSGYESSPTILYSFAGSLFPTSGLTSDRTGNLFGTGGFGTV